MSAPIIIVGSSLAGLRSAEQLRSQGWSGPITLVGEEPHRPYNRPPLSKQALADARDGSLDGLHESVALPLKPRLGDIDWRLGRRAVSANLEKRQIELDDGESLAYRGLVVATGLRPRHLPLAGGERQRHRIRTLDDAWRLGKELTQGRHIAIAGAGFIGCELAATARKLGCRVTVIDAASTPLGGVLGSALSEALLAYHHSHGVEFRLNTRIAQIQQDRCGNLAGLTLADGSTLETQLLVEAIGAIPNTEWLDGNGLDLGNGVLCHDDLSIPGHPDVIAVGDIARFANPLIDETPRRIEHWNIAVETARRGVTSLLGHLEAKGPAAPGTPRPIVPSFWSDQFSIKLQGIGMPALGDTIRPIEGGPEAFTNGETLAMGYYRSGTLIGITSIHGEKQQPRYRQMLLEALST